MVRLKLDVRCISVWIALFRDIMMSYLILFERNFKKILFVTIGNFVVHLDAMPMFCGVLGFSYQFTGVILLHE